jgi:hypothetical protein
MVQGGAITLLPFFINMVMVASNTDLADINEILLGYFMAGSDWNKLGNDAKTQHDAKALKATDVEYDQQYGRAQSMAEYSIAWAKANGYSGNIKKVWWTARPGSMEDAVGVPVDQSKNPTDILVQFTKGPANGFLGVSAKSTKGKTDIGFKNPGLGTIEKALSIKLKKTDDDAIAEMVKRFGLNKSATTRKKEIRANAGIQKVTQARGAVVLSDIRDKLFKKLKSMSNNDLREYILSDWIDSSSSMYPPYIKATGMGKAAPYTAKIDDPLKNEKLDYLNAETLTLSKVGTTSVGIKAGPKQIMKMRVKYESEPLATSIKFSGDPW